jgi:hypothetical protein
LPMKKLINFSSGFEKLLPISSTNLLPRIVRDPYQNLWLITSQRLLSLLITTVPINNPQQPQTARTQAFLS